MEFKCRLRVIFAEKEIRQKEFSKRIGISQSTLSSLVNNTKLPTFPTAYKIAKALNMHIEDIWIEDTEKEESIYL
ncbi:XRE family transcriptional regulator [Bacillus mycoides]|uniref:helix-turn-helix transcriptional regulator n=1 Tax=Bacillus mycoides TaxID=1405 RepID=UPI001C01F9AE|nr:helix-turn-helix transcriptional regulator [Bacillus mycoides]QWH60215.1 XRE family transcriptional regulator [Bacillus mycoides]